MNTFDLTLDLSKRGPFQSVPIRQGDKNGTIIRATITDHGVAVSTSGLTARFVMRLPDNEHYYRETATLSGSTATVTIDEAQAASAAGRTDVAYFQLLQGTDVIASTESFTVVVLPDALADAEVAESYDSAIQDAIDNLSEAVEQLPSTVEDVLADHPEWTTTVQDGSITEAKLGTDLARDRERLLYRLANMLTASLPEGDVATASDAAKTPMAGLALYGRSTQDGTPTPDAPVPIKSVTPNLFHLTRQVGGTNVSSSNVSDVSVTDEVLTFTATSVNPYYGAIQGSGQAHTNSAGFLIPVKEGLTYTLCASNPKMNQLIVTGYDASKVSLGNSSLTVNGGRATYTVPSGTAYIVVRIGLTGAAASVVGTTYSTAFAVYEGDVWYPCVPYQSVGLLALGRNLIQSLEANRKYNDTTGSGEANNNFSRSQVFPFPPSTALTVSTTYTGTTMCFLYEWKSDGTYIGVQQDRTAKTLYNFTTSAGTGFVSVAYRAGIAASDGLFTNPQAEVGSVAHSYEPYAPVTIPIDLGGRSLRSLPDGTRDEVTVDERGHAMLVQRVGSVEITAFDGTNASGGRPYGYKTIKGKSTNTTGNRLLCDKLTTTNGSNYNIGNNPTNVVVRGLSGQAQTDLGPAVLPLTVQYPLATPVTIDLGYVDAVPLVGPDLTAQAIPTAPMQLTYERDLNATLARLESAIAELATN